MNGYLMSIPDRPGAAAGFFEKAAARGVNVHPAYALADGTTGMLLVGAEDEAGLKAAIADAGLSGTAYEMVVTELENRAGTGARLLRRLADAGVDLRAIVPLGTSGDRLQIALAASDTALLKRTLGV